MLPQTKTAVKKEALNWNTKSNSKRNEEWTPGISEWLKVVLYCQNGTIIPYC